jgi:putative intracellular protease/amidase
MKKLILILMMTTLSNTMMANPNGKDAEPMKILIWLTNHGELAGEKNGTYAPELTHAIHELEKAGFSYDLASIDGGAAPLYGEDVENDKIHAKVLADAELQRQLKNTKAVADVNPADYAGVFYPGGYGVLFDLSKNEAAAAITAHIYENGGVVGGVCHGPAGLLPVTLSDGSNIMAGKEVTAFTREEEVAGETIDKIPFLLETALLEKAGRFSKVPNWGENVVIEGRVITGQNPASAHGVGKAMAKRILAKSQSGK